MLNDFLFLLYKWIWYSIVMLALLCCRAVKSLHGIHWRKRVVSVQNEVNYINSKVLFCIWKIFHHGLAFFVQSSRFFGGKVENAFVHENVRLFPHLLEKKKITIIDVYCIIAVEGMFFGYQQFCFPERGLWWKIILFFFSGRRVLKRAVIIEDITEDLPR